MLVKTSIVEKWYQRDSFVYRNFAYLFVNSLWEKRIPQGFSVCPYFKFIDTTEDNQPK